MFMPLVTAILAARLLEYINYTAITLNKKRRY